MGAKGAFAPLFLFFISTEGIPLSVGKFNQKKHTTSYGFLKICPL
jgi:hypothetical protein